MSSAGEALATQRAMELGDIMWKVDAYLFYRITSSIARLHAVTRFASEKLKLDTNSIFSENGAKDVLPSLKTLSDELDILGARLTAASVRRFEHALSSKKCTQAMVIQHTSDIDTRLRDELTLVNLYVLDENRIKYFAPAQIIYDQDVVDKFPLAVTDIEDAGKCLSFGQGTASVFHSMRVMELGLKALTRRANQILNSKSSSPPQ